MSPSREYAGVLASIVIGAGTAIICLNRGWLITSTTVLPGADETSVEVVVSGSELVTGSAAAAWAALLCALAVLATRRFGRLLAGVVLIMSGGYLAVQGARSGLSAPDDVVVTSWWIPTAVAGSVILVTGVLAIARGGTWPTLSRRYERGARPVHEESAWDALDAGRDPTLPDD